MPGLYVYALLGNLPLDDLGQGLRGERLVVLPSGSLFAAVGQMEAAPPIDSETLRLHDATVRRLATHVEAILPVRFGTHLASEHTLHERLAEQHAELSRALALVRGREQVTLRVFRRGQRPLSRPSNLAPAEGGPKASPLQEADLEPRGGPGTQFLLARQAARRRAQMVPELEPLRPVLAPLVLAERVERHTDGRLVATVFHLIKRGAASSYIEQVTASGALPDDLRVAVTGPWPPYAFAPETLG